MSGQTMPPQPLPAGNDRPAQQPQAASRPGPHQAAPAGDGKAIASGLAEVDATPAGAGGSTTPAGVGAEAPPAPPVTVLDPAAVTGPPWPRLVAPAGGYTPPRLIRWPVVVGIVLLAGWIAAALAMRAAPASSPRPVTASRPGSAGAYVLSARDAHFTATFPGKPQRTTQAAGAVTVIAYLAQVSSQGIGVTYVPLPASVPFSLNGGINGAVASLPAGKVISRRTFTYLGQPAEDATISSSAGFAQIRVVRFGSAAYVLEGFGNTPDSFAHDYKVLLDTFTPHP
jgi:hypothetical protein